MIGIAFICLIPHTGLDSAKVTTTTTTTLHLKVLTLLTGTGVVAPLRKRGCSQVGSNETYHQMKRRRSEGSDNDHDKPYPIKSNSSGETNLSLRKWPWIWCWDCSVLWTRWQVTDCWRRFKSQWSLSGGSRDLKGFCHSQVLSTKTGFALQKQALKMKKSILCTL